MAAYNANVYRPDDILPEQGFVPPPKAPQIHDYLIWSVLNLLFGWFIGGLIALIFSIVCRSRKRRNDYEGARTMSTVALVLNAVISTIGILCWISFIISVIIYYKYRY